MTGSKEGNTSQTIPVVQYLAEAGAFGEFRLKGAGSRVEAALTLYLRPFLQGGLIERVAVGYEDKSSRAFPFGNIRLLPVFASQEAVQASKKIVEDLVTNPDADYSDLPLRFYPTVKGENGTIDPKLYAEFTSGIVGEAADYSASQLRFGFFK
jgi:hypothetical protein